MNKNKFYNFAFNNNVTELYLYGAIVSDKWCDEDISFKDFKDAVDSMSDNGVLKVYINSPGGEVFTTQSIISFLRRAKETKNIKIESYIDSLGASCASWLPMISDEIYAYKGSILMLHKPMTYAFGANANDLRKEIELLDKIEETEMIPMYMSKVKDGVTEDTIRNLLSKESWLDYNEMTEYFNITLLDKDSSMVACIDDELFKHYNHVPQELLDKAKEVNDMEDTQEVIETQDEVIEQTEETEVSNVEDIDNTDEENEEETEVEDVEEKKSESNEEVQDKLIKANETIIALNDELEKLQKIADLYEAEQNKKTQAEQEKLLDEKKTYYKNKFEKLGAKDKYESEEVQNLINNCLKDKESLSQLNQMVVDMLSVEEKVVRKDIVEPVSKVENLIPTADGAEKYGFK